MEIFFGRRQLCLQTLDLLLREAQLLVRLHDQTLFKDLNPFQHAGVSQGAHVSHEEGRRFDGEGASMQMMKAYVGAVSETEVVVAPLLVQAAEAADDVQQLHGFFAHGSLLL